MITNLTHTNIMMITMILEMINMSLTIISSVRILRQSLRCKIITIITIMFIIIFTWEGEVRAECFEADKAVDCHLIGLIIMMIVMIILMTRRMTFYDDDDDDLTGEDPCLPRNVLKRLQATIPGCAEPDCHNNCNDLN